MRSSKWDFPHPLLAEGRDDYSVGRFEILEKAEARKTTENEFEFWFCYELECAGLESYVKEGKAELILRISSAAASFRISDRFDINTKELCVRLKKNQLVKNIEFTAYIVATGDTKFSLPEHNEYYRGIEFSLRSGDILAESATIRIDLDDTELQKPLSSIFLISACEKDSVEVVSPDFDSDKINIVLSKELYEKYDRLRKEHPDLRRNLSAVITMSVLAEAIEIMQSPDRDEYSEYRWYRALSNRLVAHGIDIDDASFSSTTLANKIYGNIMLDAISAIKNKLDYVITHDELDAEETD